ncbi:DUF2306 domain-containing protein [Dokdonella soli]|uniref:DUF2306 domain-containing protein n=2 Tax=Dokdonella soli TaxID=529810 RepID=A0ABP3TJQ6_9GAMM
MPDLATGALLDQSPPKAKSFISGTQADGRRSLRVAAISWFAVAATGQLLFVVYLLLLYGRAALRGDWAALNKVMPHGYVPGDVPGNLTIALHILLAVIITLGGLIQLVPQIRLRAPAFHRWNGRVYMTCVAATCVAGLYMVWVRGGGPGDLSQNLGITFDAVLILLCAGMALRHALARQIAVHRQWALRLFMAANGVWFFRVGLMFWILLNHGPVGFDPKTFTGPFLTFLSFADILLPLAVLELYLRAKERGRTPQRIAVAATLGVLTVAMATGIFGAVVGLWLPNVQ